jgi:hypothetical protein
MINIQKNEYDRNKADFLRGESTSLPVSFYDLTDARMTRQDFANILAPVIGQSANVLYVEDRGTHITLHYSSHVYGTLEITPAPDKPKSKQDKRPSKNLESLVALCNRKGWHVSVSQYGKAWNHEWYVTLFRDDDLSKCIISPTDESYPTAYAALKATARLAWIL